MKSMKFFIGIDPGASGACACLDEEGHHVFNIWWPVDDNIHDLWASLKRQNIQVGNVVATIEKVSPMPQQGVCSMFTFGGNFMTWQAFMTALDIPYTFVTPQAWQKDMLDGKAVTKLERISDKWECDKCFSKITRKILDKKPVQHGHTDTQSQYFCGGILHPYYKEKKDTKKMSLDTARRMYPAIGDSLKREKDHGLADALLIAEWGRRQKRR